MAPIKPIVVIAKSSYATGGVGLRNRGAGNISVSGLVGAPKLTFIYWAVISVGAPPAPATSINVQRLYPIPVRRSSICPESSSASDPRPAGIRRARRLSSPSIARWFPCLL